MFESVVKSREWTTFKDWVSRCLSRRTRPGGKVMSPGLPQGSCASATSSAAVSRRTSVDGKTNVVCESFATGLEERYGEDQASRSRKSFIFSVIGKGRRASSVALDGSIASSPRDGSAAGSVFWSTT